MIAWLWMACGGLDAYNNPSGPAMCSAEGTPRLLRRLTHDEYASSVRDVLGAEVDPASFAADPVVDGFRNDAQALVVSDLLAAQYQTTAESVAESVDADALVPCDRGVVGDAGCAAAFIEEVGFELFRRPLTQADIDDYVDLWTEVATEDGMDEGLEWVLVAMLQSPHFLYRSELGARDEDGLFALTKWELATELSYDLLGTTPSRDLLDRVSDGLLADPADVADVAAEMLADPRALASVSAFAEVWLDTSQLATVSRDGLTPELRDDMADQTADFVSTLAGEGGTLRDLLVPPATAVSGGMSEGGGGVEFGADGVLTEASVLTTHGRPTGSGPVQRGVFVRERLLCEELPPPPSNLDVSPPAVDVTKTTREQYATHASDPACSGCHDKIDPLGFAFEHYDQLGQWRELDNGLPIDDSGNVDGLPFEGPDGLARLLLDDPRFRTCFVSTWRRHATGLATCGEDLGADVPILEPLASVPGLPGFVARGGGAEEGDTLATGERGVPDAPDDVELPPGGIELVIEVTSDWGAGFCADASVSNEGDRGVTWTVRAEADGHIDNIWDAVVRTEGTDWVFSGMSWNASLPAGGSTRFGFCASR